jgi:oxygen-independent coproporphyrinogen-3 oxidase
MDARCPVQLHSEPLIAQLAQAKYDADVKTGNEPFCLYIHIPYCAAKCPYCDFNVRVARRIPEGEYTAALLSELESYARSDDWRSRKLKTVFFGGGTPSMFSPGSIGKIIDRAASLFPVADDAEVTLEANPESEDQKRFAGYRSRGVNRLSLGAQSFQPHVLKLLGRLHSADETRDALRTTRNAGFENFSLDLIYGIPGQSLPDLGADLSEALSFQPPHLSAYNLTIEEKTAFHYQLRTGKFRPLPEEEEIAMAELIEETLSKAGLERYEISNYARPGSQSRHNMTYWEGGDYLGIGTGSHSYLRRDAAGGIVGLRWHNEKNPQRYMEAVEREGAAVAETETLDLKKAAAECLFMGLRMMKGISVDDFVRRFGKEPAEFYPHIGDWLEAGLMERQTGRLRLTRRGLMVADSIFVELV